MTEFLIQNPWLILIVLIVLSVGLLFLPKQKQINCSYPEARTDWAEQTGVETKCPCGAWEVCEVCNIRKKPH